MRSPKRMATSASAKDSVPLPNSDFTKANRSLGGENGSTGIEFHPITSYIILVRKDKVW